MLTKLFFIVVLLYIGANCIKFNSEQGYQNWVNQNVNFNGLTRYTYTVRDPVPTPPGYTPNLPNQLLGEDQVLNVTVVDATTIALGNQLSNRAFPQGDDLRLGTLASGLKRIIILFDSVGVYNRKDWINKATLTLTLSNAESCSGHCNSPKIRVNRLSINPGLTDFTRTTWKCYKDSKITNNFEDCDQIWNGGFISDSPDIDISDRVDSNGVLTLDVTDLLRKNPNSDGMGGLIVRLDNEITGHNSAEFQSIGSQNPPRLWITVPGIKGNITSFPAGTPCKSKFKNVFTQSQNVNVHYIFCPATTPHPKNDIVLFQGVPWNVNANAYIAPLDELRKLGDVYLPEYLCHGLTACPSNSTFAYGVPNEATVYEKLLFDILKLKDVVMYGWDRMTPIEAVIAARRPDKVSLVVLSEAWPFNFVCSPEHDALPPGDPARCSRRGWMLRACSGVDEFDECIPRRPGVVFDCIGRSKNCTKCFTDFAPDQGVFTKWWIFNNISGIATVPGSAIGDIRFGCFNSENPPFSVSDMEIPIGGGLSLIPSFTPDNGFGVGPRVLTPQEIAFFMQDQVAVTTPGTDLLVNQFIEFYGGDLEALPTSGWTNDFGLTALDTQTADEFQLFSQLVESGDIQAVFVQFDPLPGTEPFQPFVGNPLIYIADPEYIRTGIETTGLLEVKTQWCHASVLCNPNIVAGWLSHLIQDAA